MFDVYSCNALSARFFDVDRALNSYFMIMIKAGQVIAAIVAVIGFCRILIFFWTLSPEHLLPPATTT